MPWPSSHAHSKAPPPPRSAQIAWGPAKAHGLASHGNSATGCERQGAERTCAHVRLVFGKAFAGRANAVVRVSHRAGLGVHIVHTNGTRIEQSARMRTARVVVCTHDVPPGTLH